MRAHFLCVEQRGPLKRLLQPRECTELQRVIGCFSRLVLLECFPCCGYAVRRSDRTSKNIAAFVCARRIASNEALEPGCWQLGSFHEPLALGENDASLADAREERFLGVLPRFFETKSHRVRERLEHALEEFQTEAHTQHKHNTNQNPKPPSREETKAYAGPLRTATVRRSICFSFYFYFCQVTFLCFQM